MKMVFLKGRPLFLLIYCSWPGQLALGYICEDGHIKHHLLESSELKNQSFVDWLVNQRQFTHILQCVGFAPETKKPMFKKQHKNLAFSPFFHLMNNRKMM